MPSAILQQLDTYGPQRCERLSRREAEAYTRRLAGSHYENFSVVTRLLPRRLRGDFANVYAFCRWADDLGDEAGDPARSLELLAWWRRELAACYADEPRHPVFIALRPTIRRHDIPPEPFERLIEAFEQDQRVHRYETWEQVIDYCTRSANPVGRLVLHMCGYSDAERQRLSDATCTALQLINFWQDVRRDIAERDRIYIPAEALAEHGLSHDDLTGHVRGAQPGAAVPHGLSEEQRERYRRVIRDLVERTRPLFEEGRRLWPLLSRDVRPSIRLFTLGGEAVVRAVERIGYDTIDRRPALSKATKARLMGRALAGRVMSIGAGPGGGGATP